MGQINPAGQTFPLEEFREAWEGNSFPEFVPVDTTIFPTKRETEYPYGGGTRSPANRRDRHLEMGILS